jgi:integration host factor subunit alpha
MADETVTRADLSEAVYQEVGLSRNESAELVESVLSEISDKLTRGEAVKISSFGSFSVRQKGQRVGRNPKTGEEVPILPRKVLVFRASNVLKNRINDGAGDAERLTGHHSDSTPLQQQGSSAPVTGRAPFGSGS